MFDRNLMKLSGMHPIMMSLLLLALLQAAAIIGQAFTLSSALASLWAGSSISEVLPSVFAFFACFALLHLIRFGQDTMLDRFSEKQAGNLRDAILDSTFDGNTMLANDHGAAIVATTATEGIDEVQTYVRIIPPKIIGMVAISIPILVAAYLSDWVSGIILTVMFPVIIFFMILLGRQASARAERQYAAYTRLSNRFMDSLRGLDVIKAFGAADSEAKSVYSYSERLRTATVRTLTTATLSSVVLDLCATFGVAAVAMMLAFRLMDGSIGLEAALTALILAPEYFSPIRSFASDFHASLDGKNALAAVLSMMGSASKISDDSQDDELEQADTEDPEVGMQAHDELNDAGMQVSPIDLVSDSLTPIEWGSESVLELSNVTFIYEGGGTVGPISLTTKGFEKIALVGKSGAGKSTLANLLAGFKLPTEGAVTIDGKPVDLSSQSWKRSVRYIPQNPYIFNATLLDNIRFYVPQAPIEDVEAIIETVGLADLVNELPDGLMTVIGQGGRGLSGGQAHRIALARVLVDPEARVLIFDEPTAHLDIETEQDLKPAMLSAMEGKLVFFATHRLHWTREMDRVISLDAGRIVSDVVDRGNFKADYDDLSSLVASNEKYGNAARSLGAVVDGDNGKSDEPATPDKQRTPSWFTAFLSRYKRSVVVALVLGLIASGFAALLMFTSGYLISATAQPGMTLFAVMIPVAFVQVFGLGKPLARYLERLVSHDWVLKVTSDLRLALFKGIERRIGDPAREKAAGEYLSILSDDIAHLQNLYLRVVFPISIAMLLAVGATVLFGVFSIPFALIMLLVFVVTALALPYLALTFTRIRSRNVKDLRARHFAKLTDDVMGSTDWILANRGEDAVADHSCKDTFIRSSEGRNRLALRGFTLTSTLLLGIAACFVTLWAGDTFNGAHQDVNWIAAFALGFFPLIEAFSALPDAFSQAPQHEDALGRLDGYMQDGVDSQVNARDVENADKRTGKRVSTEENASEAGATIASGSTGEDALQFVDVTYSYPGASKQALDNVSISIPRGQTVAMLGRSGSGKSTFAQLARGVLEPREGEVLIFGTKPENDISQVLGYLGQTPYLFNRTLRENLTLGVADVDDDSLIQTLYSTGLKEKFDSLDEGLDTVIGETGTGFSGGESHRIALARVLVANTPLVIVDEPFSALDPETEADLLETMLDVCSGKTLLVITHHLAEIERFDRVVFVENGTVELDGTPNELKERSERFRQLIEFDRGAVRP